MQTNANMDLAETILHSARVVKRETDRIYCVGPPSGRLSFLSQQVRAMNLVWALGKKSIVAPGKAVGVVGGGIAGLSAAVTLRAKGCHVTVYERSKALLHRQRGATHRHAHPIINWWPHEVPTLLPTTSLPFLNWGMDQCDRIVERMMDQWDRLAKASGKSLTVHHEDVNRAVPNPAEGNRLVLKSGAKEVGKGFDVVIVASGFGEELSVPGLPHYSYWEQDNLEKIRNTPGEIELFVVSGFGDGGLLDALRIAYAFKSGALSFKVAQLIDRTPLKDEITSLGLDESAWLAFARKIHESMDQNSVLGQVGLLLSDALRAGTGDIQLIDKDHASPFHGPAAPIHKLMIAYAVHRGAVSYRKGELRPTDQEGSYFVGTERHSLDKTHFIVRHGAKPFSGGLISEEEWALLMAVADKAREYSFKPAWTAGELEVPEGWHCPVKQPKEFIQSIHEEAALIWKEISPTSNLSIRDNRFVVTGHSTNYRPDTLFGMQVEYRSSDLSGRAFNVE